MTDEQRWAHNEQVYICATNLVRLRTAKTLVNELSENEIVSDDEIRSTTRHLARLEQRTYDLYKRLTR